MKHAAASMLATLALAGCSALGLNAKAPDEAETRLSFEVPASWESQLMAGDAALSAGWAGLYGPQLSALIDEALANNPDLQASAARWADRSASQGRRKGA